VTDFILGRQFQTIQRRTNGSLVVSTVVHAAVLLLLLVGNRAAPESLGLAEITWVQGAELDGEPDAAPPVAREETKSAPVADVATRAVSRDAEKTEHFKREVMQSSMSPDPQASRAVSDLVAAKLDTWEHKATSDRTRVAAMVAPPRVGVPALAGVPNAPAGPASSPTGELRRGGTGAPTPGVLQRSAPATTAPVVLAAAPEPTASRTATPARDNGSVRELAGAQLVGPVADRPLVSHRVPVYPEWAKRDGVEASVTLYFHVLPDGRVKENILVERTGGFEDFDRGAIDALRAWRFQAIPGSAEQWGRITFNYRLSDGQ